MLHAVIMAGGSGTRFWPASRAATPKQLLDLAGPRTMLQATVDRLAGLVPAERLMIVTNRRLVPAIAAQLPEVPPAAIIGEPCKRDTAPCIGLAAGLLSQTDPEAVMAVMPADHVIPDTACFQAAIRHAVDLVARQPEAIVTFGIKPTYPAESFGYIERGPALAEAGAAGPDTVSLPAFQVLRFREKPSAAVARQYLDAGNFYWNSGIFVWRAATIRDALAQYEPEMHARLAAITAAVQTPDFPDVLDREFSAIRGKSIDFAVMERYPHVLVLEAPFAWDDVGSWQSLSRLGPQDPAGNTIVGKHLGIRTQGSIIRTGDGHLVVTLGLTDCIVVHTPDATLVANKHDEEAIRQVVEQLKEKGWDEYL
jgi:mannose-1-phosphate guanylyltransferase